MASIPENIDQWSYGTIFDILNEGYEESESFEIKSEINPKGERISNTVCAFANTQGGILVFGIHSDKTKPIHERIRGLENSDQLKRNIVDQFKQIQPSIPLGCLIFRTTPLTLDDKRVIPILRILPSLIAPHQNNGKCYKRLSDGNEIMTIEEISSKIIDSRKNGNAASLLMSEAGVIQKKLLDFKNDIVKETFEQSFQILEYIPLDSFLHFLYNQSYLYEDELTQNIYLVISTVEHLQKELYFAYTIFDRIRNSNEVKERIKKENCSDLEDYIIKKAKPRVDLVLKSITSIGEILNMKIIVPTTLDELVEN